MNETSSLKYITK